MSQCIKVLQKYYGIRVLGYRVLVYSGLRELRNYVLRSRGLRVFWPWGVWILGSSGLTVFGSQGVRVFGT